MSPRRLLVVDPSAAHPETQGVEQVLQGWCGQSRVLWPALRPGDGPQPGSGYDADGIVVLGSRASVHDDLPWLAGLAGWLRPVVAGEVERPLLGICFGHQLIGHLAGAEVRDARADASKLVGIGESEVVGGRLLPGGTRLRVVYSHREVVEAVPRGYALTARRDLAAVDGFEHARLPVFGFQFHPEARGDFLRNAGLDPRAADARLVADSRRVLDAFQRVVLESRPVEAP